MVSKSWKGLLSSMSGLWIDLDLSEARRCVLFSSIMLYATYARHNLRSISLSHMDLQSEKSLLRILRKCRNLTSITINGVGLLSESLLTAMNTTTSLTELHLGAEVMILEDTIRQIMLQIPTLQCVAFLAVTLSKTRQGAWPHILPNLVAFHVRVRGEPRLLDDRVRQMVLFRRELSRSTM